MTFARPVTTTRKFHCFPPSVLVNCEFVPRPKILLNKCTFSNETLLRIMTDEQVATTTESGPCILHLKTKICQKGLILWLLNFR